MFATAALQWDLLRAYWKGVRAMQHLPDEVRLPESFSERLNEISNQLQSSMAKVAPYTIELRESVVDDFQQTLDDLRKRCLAAQSQFCLSNYERHIYPFVLGLRLLAACVALLQAFDGHTDLVVWILLSLQFIVLPLSFVPALTTLVALFVPIFSGHLIVQPVLSWLLSACLPNVVREYTFLTMDWRFIATFLVVDYAQCVYLLFRVPGAEPATLPASHVLRSAAVGLIECKSTSLVILGLLQGRRVDLAAAVADWCFGLTARITDRIAKTGYNWTTLFYPQHRVAHLPVVYQQAHKFHHVLNGTTAFDAHLYGTGVPEEFFCMLLEYTTASLLGVVPPFLNGHNLWLSWTDKLGHTMKTSDVNGQNAHPQHHVVHQRNFGIYAMAIDMIFGTCVNNDDYPMPHGLRARRSVCGPAENRVIRLEFVKDGH
jgi:hypothetical protein